jgi:hypothetical protein
MGVPRCCYICYACTRATHRLRCGSAQRGTDPCRIYMVLSLSIIRSIYSFIVAGDPIVKAGVKDNGWEIQWVLNRL